MENPNQLHEKTIVKTYRVRGIPDQFHTMEREKHLSKRNLTSPRLLIGGSPIRPIRGEGKMRWKGVMGKSKRRAGEKKKTLHEKDLPGETVNGIGRSEFTRLKPHEGARGMKRSGS